MATIWNEADMARPVDSPALQSAPAIAHWLSVMTYAQRLDLDNRMATQALLDDRLTVLGISGGWAHVLVTGQTGSTYRHGIPGWLPATQVTFKAPPHSMSTATVYVPFATVGNLTLSYGTRLPVLREFRSVLIVATPEGPRVLSAAEARLDAEPPSGGLVVSEAERFLGLPYLWGGTSAYGFDCSGLTYMVYRQFGVTLPRDAADQARAGRPVDKNHLQPGDLVFFASNNYVHHVGIYVGHGLMLDAPQTGERVEVVPLWTSAIAAQFSGARRYLG